MEPNGIIQAAKSAISSGAADPVKIETTGRGIWFLVTCSASAVAGALTYMGGYFSDGEARELEARMRQDIAEIRAHEVVQDAQLIEIAKHLGAKIVIDSGESATSQPTTSKAR